MNEVIIVLKHDTLRAKQRTRKRVTMVGAQIRQQYGPGVLIVEASPGVLKTLGSDRGVAGVYEGPVPEELSRHVDETGRLGIAAWNQRQSAAFQQAKRDRKGEGLAWDHPGFEPEGRQEP